MKCLVKGCKNNSLLMTVELCYPCSQLVEQGNDFKPDWDTVKPYLDRIAELDKGCAECGKKSSDGWALYCVKCSEPLREWVGLTDDEIALLRRQGAHSVSDRHFKAIEAKLREKNT